ncbi:MAG: HPr family phosphocarrier protein [Mycoplasma sp.]|nr:HPr family phosphocarrier protein [Candidatus Hennigella equi]
MKSIQVKITNPTYIHRQMASKLQQIAGKYTCDVDVIVGTTKANAKSLINLMTAYSKVKIPGKIEVRTSSWDDEEKAIKEIADFFGVDYK